MERQPEPGSIAYQQEIIDRKLREGSERAGRAIADLITSPEGVEACFVESNGELVHPEAATYAALKGELGRGPVAELGRPALRAVDRSIADAARRLRMVAKNPRGYAEVYPVHEGDDQPHQSRMRAHYADLRAVSDYILGSE
jgi:hypothetical protein